MLSLCLPGNIRVDVYKFGIRVNKKDEKKKLNWTNLNARRQIASERDITANGNKHYVIMKLKGYMYKTYVHSLAYAESASEWIILYCVRWDGVGNEKIFFLLLKEVVFFVCFRTWKGFPVCFLFKNRNITVIEEDTIFFLVVRARCVVEKGHTYTPFGYVFNILIFIRISFFLYL